MPPKVAKKKPAASANATSSARKPKSSLSSTTVKKISPPVSSLPGRPVTKQPRRTMNSASSSFDFSAFDDAPSQSTTNQQQEEGEEGLEGQEGTTEFGSDSGFREDEEDEDGNLSPTHEAFYPFPLPPNLNENEDLPSNSVGYQVPQLNLEPPTPAKVDNNEKQVKVVETSPEPSADTIAPQANVSSDEQAVATTAATVESQQNEDVTMDPVPKEEIKSEDMEQDSNTTAQQTSIPSEAALQAESLVPPSSPLSDAPPSSRAGLDDQPSQEADVSSSEMQIDPIKTEEEESKPPVQDEASTSQTNVIDVTSASDNAIKDEMLQSLLSAIGKRKEKEMEKENPEGTSSQDVVDEVDQMDPDFWEVEKRPSQKKMEEVRRINALRDWDKECDEMLGYERAEKERKQNDWQNQKSIRVRAEEKREMDREKGIFTPEDHYDRYDDVGSGKRGGGRGRGRDPRDRGSSKRGRGGGPPPRDPRGFVPRGDSPPRFPYSTATQIPPPSASYQPVVQPQSASQFSSNALASLTSQFATDDAKAKLAALQAQISAQPDLFNSLLAKIAAPAPPAANDGYGSNSYSQAQTQALAQVSGSYYQQPPPGSSIPVANHQSYSSPDPYGRNERAPLPPQSSLGNGPYGRSQESRDPRDAYRSTTNDYRNDTSRFTSQDPYARARSPTSTYQTNGNHLDPYGRIGTNNGLSNSRDPYSSNPMLSSSPSRPYSPNPNVGQYSSPIPNQGSDPYSNRNPNPYDRNSVMTDPYRAPPPPPASVNGWGAPPQPAVADPYSRGYPGPPPSLPDNTPAPQVTGYGARSTNAGASSGRYEDDRDRGYRGGDPYRGASRGRGGRGGQRESKTKRMMS